MLGSEVAPPSPWHSTAKVWSWMPGAYALAIASNVTIALAFQPFKQQAMWEDIDGEQIEVQCAWLDKVSYAVQMIASLGAAWCAAFLWKRAGSSGHAMSAVGYALVNWLQSVLATLISASKPWGCSYGLLTAHIDPKVAANRTIGFEFLGAEWWFLYPWNMILPLRILFYLAALVWMQVLVQRRIHALEKTSGRCYNAGSIMKMLKVQFFSIGLGAFLSCLTFVVLISLSESAAFTTSLTVVMVGGFCIVAIFLVGNVLAAVKAVCSLVKSAKDIQSILGSEMLHHAPEEVKKNLKDALWQTQLQAVAVFLSFLVSAVVVPCVVMQMDDTFSEPASSTVYPDDNVGAVLLGVFVQAIDVVGNGLTVVLLCGAHRVSAQSSQCLDRPKAICTGGVHRKDEGWKKKVEELSGRGLTLNSLLKFYMEDLPTGGRWPDGWHLPTDGWKYVPYEHKTRDVVRRVIIPLTAQEPEPCAYATSSWNRDEAQRAEIMVTHNWGNHFSHLMAAIISQALRECSYTMTAQMLDQDPDLICSILEQSGRLNDVYWICALSVNQHVCICHTNPCDEDPISGMLHPPCSCRLRNIVDSDGRCIESEINKFDDMMWHLARTGRCRHLIAVDQSMDLFNRAWCIAEIAEAKRLGMRQNLKLESRRILETHSDMRLDVRKMKCSSDRDKKLIMQKIGDVDCFNERLQSLVFGKHSGLLASWEMLDGRQQMGEMGRLLRWSLADNGTGRVWRFWGSV